MTFIVLHVLFECIYRKYIKLLPWKEIILILHAGPLSAGIPWFQACSSTAGSALWWWLATWHVIEHKSCSTTPLWPHHHAVLLHRDTNGRASMPTCKVSGCWNIIWGRPISRSSNYPPLTWLNKFLPSISRQDLAENRVRKHPKGWEEELSGLDDEEPRVTKGFRSLKTAQCNVLAGRVTLNAGGAVLHKYLSIGSSCPEKS